MYPGLHLRSYVLELYVDPLRFEVQTRFPLGSTDEVEDTEHRLACSSGSDEREARRDIGGLAWMECKVKNLES